MGSESWRSARDSATGNSPRLSGLPWAVAFGKIGLYGFWSMMVFLAVLTIGFIYEWKKGALEWD